MSGLMFMLMMQYVISLKAGFVNHVEGDVNIKATESLDAGVPIRTGPGGFAEILLNPGSYMRLGENSEVVLDRIELKNIAVHLISGAAVIEAVGFNKRVPLKVTSGALVAEIIKKGIYTFSDGRVTIVEGALRAADNRNAVFKKGRQLSNDGGYRALKVKKGDITLVEAWSRGRSKVIAAANDNIARSLRQTSSSFGVPWDGWVWVPGLGGYTFVPADYTYRSPYGYQYQTLNPADYRILRSSGNAVNNNSGNNGGESLNNSAPPESSPSAGEIDSAGEPETAGGGIPVQ